MKGCMWWSIFWASTMVVVAFYWTAVMGGFVAFSGSHWIPPILIIISLAAFWFHVDMAIKAWRETQRQNRWGRRID